MLGGLIFKIPHLRLFILSTVFYLILVWTSFCIWFTEFMWKDMGRHSLYVFIKIPCFLVSNLNCQFSSPMNLAIFLELRASPPKVGFVSSPNKTRSSSESRPIVNEIHIICWTPARQPVVKWWHATKYVITGRIRWGTRENYGVWQGFGKSKQRLNNNFSDFLLA